MQAWRFIGRAATLISRPVSKTKEKTMNLTENFRNWRRYRNTVSELSRLTNRELTDLGITRADIQSVARRAL